MATINYVTKDGALLDQKINAGLFTSVLGTPQVDLVAGGKSFTIRTISTTGLKNHTRGKGFNSGEVSDTKTVYTMTQDRDVEFYIDRQDVDETNNELAMANISNHSSTNTFNLKLMLIVSLLFTRTQKQIRRMK